MEPQSEYYEFGKFHLDPQERLLRRNGKQINLQGKLFDLLVELARRNGKLVSKNDLYQAVWGVTYVEEGNLTRCIWGLRAKLGRSRIQTVHRNGYRLVGVKKLEPEVSKVEGKFQLVEQREKLTESSPPGQPSVPENVISRRSFNTLLVQAPAAILSFPYSEAKLDQTSAPIPEGLNIISRVIVASHIKQYYQDINELLGGGINMTREDKFACNQQLLAATGKVEIVETMCHNYQTDWSYYWVRWLPELGKNPHLDRAYYVLVDSPVTGKDVDNLLTTWKFLKSAKFSLYICNKRAMKDGLGKQFPHFDSLEIFGENLLQVDYPSPKRGTKVCSFSGGLPLNVKHRNIQEGNKYADIYWLLKRYSVEMTPRVAKALKNSCWS